MPHFIDSHAHIYFREYGDETGEVLDRARRAGVDTVVCPGTCLETVRESLELSARHPMIYAAVGIHPHEASSATDDALCEISGLHEDRKVVAIGEIGLDYHYHFSPPEVQREVFTAQIEIAQRHDLPIIIHSREAEGDTLRIIGEAVKNRPEWRGRDGATGTARGVFHCFPGDDEMAREVVDLGFYVSFPGLLTFPAKPGKPNIMAGVAASVPIERILLETDSPYLTPHPFRGRKNEPAYISLIAEKLAAIRGISVDEVARTTSANAKELFGLNPG